MSYEVALSGAVDVDPVTAALVVRAREVAAREAAVIDNVAIYAGLAAMQEQVIDQYDHRVLVPRRVTWNDTRTALSAGPFTGLRLGTVLGEPWYMPSWRFDYPDLGEHVGPEGPTEIALPSHVIVVAGCAKAKLSREHRDLASCLSNEGVVSKEQVLQASRKLKIPLAQSRVLKKDVPPSLETIHQRLSEELLDHAQTISGWLYVTPPGKPREEVMPPDTMLRGSLDRPEAITFSRKDGGGGYKQVALSEATMGDFFKAWRRWYNEQNDVANSNAQPTFETVLAFMELQVVTLGARQHPRMDSINRRLEASTLAGTPGRPVISKQAPEPNTGC
jgi:hypothetical protein